MINWLQTYFNTSEELKGEKQKSVIIYSPFQTFTTFIFLCSIKGVCLSLPFSLFVTQSYWLQKTWIIVYDVINMWYELLLSVSCHFGVWQTQPPSKKKKKRKKEIESYEFGISWKKVKDDIMHICGWTTPLNVLRWVHSEHYHSHYALSFSITWVVLKNDFSCEVNFSFTSTFTIWRNGKG